jgi:hypothetical protein
MLEQDWSQPPLCSGDYGPPLGSSLGIPCCFSAQRLGLERLLGMGLRLLQEELRLQEPLVQARVQEQRQGGQWVER